MQVGYTVPWMALSSELGYLKMLHGPSIYLHLNAAFFAPSLPVLAIQLMFDHRVNELFGTARSTLHRQTGALLLCAASCMALPFTTWHRFAPAPTAHMYVSTRSAQ